MLSSRRYRLADALASVLVPQLGRSGVWASRRCMNPVAFRLPSARSQGGSLEPMLVPLALASSHSQLYGGMDQDRECGSVAAF